MNRQTYSLIFRTSLRPTGHGGDMRIQETEIRIKTKSYSFCLLTSVFCILILSSDLQVMGGSEKKEVSMKCQVIGTDKAPAAIGPYSQAIKAGSWLFVSGQLGMKPETGNLVSDDLGEQARQALDNLGAIVRAAGYELSDVVAVDVFVTDISQFVSFNTIYERYFSEHKPARAVVEVKGLPKGAKVEIKCVAYRQE